jgi:hypothetical protein
VFGQTGPSRILTLSLATMVNSTHSFAAFRQRIFHPFGQ